MSCYLGHGGPRIECAQGNAHALEFMTMSSEGNQSSERRPHGVRSCWVSKSKVGEIGPRSGEILHGGIVKVIESGSGNRDLLEVSELMKGGYTGWCSRPVPGHESRKIR